MADRWNYRRITPEEIATGHIPCWKCAHFGGDTLPRLNWCDLRHMHGGTLYTCDEGKEKA